MKSIIVAYTNNHVIGNKGALPWDLPNDLKNFKRLTSGNTIIMGRKTYESIGRPLPNRRNIVITRNKQYKVEGVEVVPSLEAAYSLVDSNEHVFVIGGGEIYSQAIDSVDDIYATVIDTNLEGDTTFPRINLDTWKLSELTKEADEESGLNYYFTHFTRRKTEPKLYYIDAGRSLEQIRQMEDLEERGVCIFCPEHFKKEHREPIETETKYWLVTKNDYPYKYTKTHLLLVPKKHVSMFSELPQAAQNEFTQLIVNFEKEYKPPSYSQFMRVGSFYNNGASVQHLHGHIVIADSEHPDFTHLKVKLGSKKST